jgi:TatD DNase family protein
MNKDYFLEGLVDLHCHVDLYPSPSQIIKDCDNKGIRTLAVTTTPKAWPGNKRFTDKSKYVRPALGLHPKLISERVSEFDLFNNYLPEAKYIGEVGLDKRMSNKRSFDLQSEILSQILITCSKTEGKILSLHGVRAWSELLDLLENNLNFRHCRVILHWFTGSKKQLERAVEMGCYFSLNIKNFQSKNSQSILEALPIDRVLTETDGPFVKIGKRAAHPADVSRVVAQCAHLWNITSGETVNIILNNFRRIVSV